MRTVLKAGAELDTLTAPELEEILDRRLSGFLRPAQTLRLTEGIKLNGSGNTVIGGQALAAPIYTVPPGMVFRLHRLGVFPDGFTFGAPYTAAGGYLEVRRGEVAWDGVSFDPTLNPTGLPVIFTAGTADGIEYRNGESVTVYVSGGPASASLTVRAQGTLEPHTEF